MHLVRSDLVLYFQYLVPNTYYLSNRIYTPFNINKNNIDKMPNNVKKKLAQFKNAVAQIIEKAKEDGKITVEEENIIKIAESNLKEFENMVEQALEDDVITQEERNALIDLEEKVMSDTYFKAVEDDVIDTDEMALLKALFHTLSPRQTLSWLNEDAE